MELSFSAFLLVVVCVSSAVTGAAQVIDVTKYGAKGDGSSDMSQVRAQEGKA